VSVLELLNVVTVYKYIYIYMYIYKHVFYIYIYIYIQYDNEEISYVNTITHET
jgi:hypothetical protein